MNVPVSVLLVDDIPETLVYIERILQATAFVVVGRARDGLEAISEAHRLRPDVVLLDLMMPKLQGIAAARIIRTELPDVRVVVMSIQNDPDYLRRAKAAGVSEYLVKPFSVDEMKLAIRGAMARPPGDVSSDPSDIDPRASTGHSNAGVSVPTMPMHATEGVDDDLDPAEAAADEAATMMAPPNLHRRIRRQAVAGGQIEYFPGAWDQTWSVTRHATTGAWTVFDQRASEDGGGEMDELFSTADKAVDFVTSEVAEHDRHMRNVWVRSVDPGDHVELRRFMARLRLRLRSIGVEVRD